MKGRRWRIACAALALVAGCGRGRETPTGPVTEDLSPRIAAVYPAARSSGVIYDTPIWVVFAEALAPATVNERTVFLKLDTVRIPTTITYDEATRTIRLAPRAALALRRTHTVEITPAVATATGHPLGRTSFWQFTTNSLRRPGTPNPVDGTRGESPFATLQWAATETSAGTVEYEVYAGADSAAIAARSVVPLRVEPRAFSLPRTRWGYDTRRYWAITAVNRTTSERLEGPVWRFETMPAGLPVDSLDVPPDDWGWYWRVRPTKSCTGLASGPDYHPGIRWRVRETAGGLKLAGARLTLWASVLTDVRVSHPTIFGVQEPWPPCGFSPTVPLVDRSAELAVATQAGISQDIYFASDFLTAHLEAMARYGLVYGYYLETNSNLTYASPSSTSEFLRPVLRLYYRRPPPGAEARARAPAAGDPPGATATPDRDFRLDLR